MADSPAAAVKHSPARFPLPITKRTLPFAYVFVSASAAFTVYLAYNSGGGISDIVAAALENSGGGFSTFDNNQTRTTSTELSSVQSGNKTQFGNGSAAIKDRHSSTRSTNRTWESFDKAASFTPSNGSSGKQVDGGVISSGKSTAATNWTELSSNSAGSGDPDANLDSDFTEAKTGETAKQGMAEALLENLEGCDLFDGEWVMDDSYPLYEPGSCSSIEPEFNCILNGRPDKDFQKYKWNPRGCNLPRMNGGRMLEMLRGKRLVFVGDSLNRNMWESMVCMLKAASKDQSRVYEAQGNRFFWGKPSYSFVFKDYNCSVEFFMTPFLVQEWREFADKNETLRLDLMEKSSAQYKDADFIVFNTGHWWNHEKTSLGKDYYQEGSHVYPYLDVDEAFRKALMTWSRWVDASVDSTKSMVLFRGYSAAHFSGGQWNSGGTCQNEVEPVKNTTNLTGYPKKMVVLEEALRGMKTSVKYLNVTRMTDYRSDAHPSIYGRPYNINKKKNKRSLKRVQDCSHWCLPGVPDAWNEILYAHVLMNENRRKHSLFRRGLIR